MKKLCVASSLVEADLLVARLQANGIAAAIPDRHTIGMAPHLSSVLGGVRVVVSDADWDQAREILRKPPLSLLDDQTPMELREYEPTVSNKATRRLEIVFTGGWILVIATGLYFLVRTFF